MQNNTSKIHFVIISGPSGAGKTTLLNMMCQKYGFKRFVSYTTRNMREGEKDGVDYHFVSQQQFDNLEQEGFFIETTKVFGHRYGSSRHDMLHYTHDTVLDVDLQGVLSLQQKITNAVYVMVMPPSKGILKERLIARGESGDFLNSRVASFDEFDHNQDMFQLNLVNDDRQVMLDELASYLAK